MTLHLKESNKTLSCEQQNKDIIKTLLKYEQDIFDTDFISSFLPSYSGGINVSYVAKSSNEKNIEQQSQSTLEAFQAQENNYKNNDQSIPMKKNAITPLSTNVDLSNISSIEDLINAVNNFNGCALKTQNTNTVFVDGNIKSNILLIGEAPGEDENENKIPFCGKSGKLLMAALKSIGLERDRDFFITNTVFYRPPQNRAPTDLEIQSCKPFVEKLIELTDVKYIICVGGTSLKSYIGFDSISASRRKMCDLQIGLKTVKATAVYHPSFLLRSPFKKKDMFYDLLWIKNNFL